MHLRSGEAGIVMIHRMFHGAPSSIQLIQRRCTTPGETTRASEHQRRALAQSRIVGRTPKGRSAGPSYRAAAHRKRPVAARRQAVDIAGSPYHSDITLIGACDATDATHQ